MLAASDLEAILEDEPLSTNADLRPGNYSAYLAGGGGPTRYQLRRQFSEMALGASAGNIARHSFSGVSGSSGHVNHGTTGSSSAVR